MMASHGLERVLICTGLIYIAIILGLHSFFTLRRRAEDLHTVKESIGYNGYDSINHNGI